MTERKGILLHKGLMVSVAVLTFALHNADASVAPDPSDATVLVANVAEGVTETYADKIASSYTKFVKTGKGTLILTAASSNSKDPPYFQGAVEVRQGILQLDNYNAIRSASYINDTTQYKVSVSSNAQIRVTFNAVGPRENALYNVAIEGDGPDGSGAFVFNGGGSGEGLIRVLHLTGDASIGGTGRFGVGFWGELYLNGHTLTGLNSDYRFFGVQVVKNREGHFVKRGGAVTFENDTNSSSKRDVKLNGSAANTFTLSNATLKCWKTATLDSLWTLRSLGSSTFQVKELVPWRGPIIGDGGDLTLRAYDSEAGSGLNLYGTITNLSKLTTLNDAGALSVNLVNADHYIDTLTHNQGDMVVTGGQHHVFGSIVVNCSNSTKPTSLTFKDAGEVAVTNATANGRNRVYSSNNAQSPAHMAISGRTNFRSETGTLFMVGDDSTAGWADQYPNYWGSLAVTDGATMTNDELQVGYRGAGALYQRDSDVYAGKLLYLGYGINNKNGVLAYGYYGATNSQLTLAGGMNIACATNSTAFFVQRGGRTDLTNSDASYISYRGHAGVYVGNGGILNKATGGFCLGYKDVSYYGGSASVTVDGEGSLFDLSTRSLSWMCHNGFKTFVNLNNGGTLRVYRLQHEMYREAYLRNSRVYLSFDGGVLYFDPPSNVADYKGFMEWKSGDNTCQSHPDVCTVFGGGAVIGVSSTNTVHWTCPLLKPSGKSVTAIALPTAADFGTTVHLGALRVVIEGEGEGASAFVDFDDATGTPSKIIVTSPGINYVEGTTTAKVIEMRAKKEWSCAVALGEIKSGGLTKIGPGTLLLKDDATYEGATTVREGTIILASQTTQFPEGQPIILAGGTFNSQTHNLIVSDLSGYGTYSSDNGRSVTITNKLSFAAADALAGRQLTFEHVEPVFTAGAKIEIDTTGLSDNQEPHRFVLATSEKTFVGDPVLVNAGTKWGLRLSADRKSILFRRIRGQAISFR